MSERDKRRLEADTYKLKIRKASKGECKGDVVAKSSVTLAELANVTLVVRPDGAANTITRFTNDVSPTGGGQIRFITAHMMKGGAVDVWANGVEEISGLARGATDAVTLNADVVYSAWGTQAGADRADRRPARDRQHDAGTGIHVRDGRHQGREQPPGDLQAGGRHGLTGHIGGRGAGLRYHRLVS